MKLQNKVAIITGASRGVGAAAAVLFAKEGASIVIDYFVSDYEPDAKENAEKVKKEIESFGGKAIIVPCDVREENQIKNMVKVALDNFGKIDILVSNAAIVYDLPIEERTLEQWNRTINTNLLGTFLCLKYVSQAMENGGAIVCASSTNVINFPSPESLDYDASKAGIMTLSKNFAKHLADRHIRVNATAAGWINTPMNKDLPDDFVKGVTEEIYLKRFAQPEEIAKLYLFLVSDDSSYINASNVVIDGGHD